MTDDFDDTDVLPFEPERWGTVLVVNGREITERQLNDMHDMWVRGNRIDVIAMLYGLHRVQLGWCLRHHAEDNFTMH